MNNLERQDIPEVMFTDDLHLSRAKSFSDQRNCFSHEVNISNETDSDVYVLDMNGETVAVIPAYNQNTNGLSPSFKKTPYTDKSMYAPSPNRIHERIFIQYRSFIGDTANRDKNYTPISEVSKCITLTPNNFGSSGALYLRELGYNIFLGRPKWKMKTLKERMNSLFHELTTQTKDGLLDKLPFVVYHNTNIQAPYGFIGLSNGIIFPCPLIRTSEMDSDECQIIIRKSNTGTIDNISHHFFSVSELLKDDDGVISIGTYDESTNLSDMIFGFNYGKLSTYLAQGIDKHKDIETQKIREETIEEIIGPIPEDLQGTISVFRAREDKEDALRKVRKEKDSIIDNLSEQTTKKDQLIDTLNNDLKNLQDHVTTIEKRYKQAQEDLKYFRDPVNQQEKEKEEIHSRKRKQKTERHREFNETVKTSLGVVTAVMTIWSIIKDPIVKLCKAIFRAPKMA